MLILNGDTFIGNTVKLVLADDGNVGVYQKVTGEYIIDDPGKLPGDSTNTIYLKEDQKTLQQATKLQEH